MRGLGLALLAVGFLVAALFSVRLKDLPAEKMVTDVEAAEVGDEVVPGEAINRWLSIEWQYYIPAFVVGVIGVVLLRISAARTDTHSDKVEANRSDLHASIGRIVAVLNEWVGKRDEFNVYSIHNMIDDRLALDLATFVNARETMIHIHGLQAYADVMTQFAAAERSINRAWSASADGYIDEVWICLDRAKTLMTNAQQTLKGAPEVQPA